MAKINGKGVPTRKTIGGLGDIYTDTNTGNRYECIFAYKVNDDSDFDCQWKYIDNVEVEKEKAPEKEAETTEKEIEEVKEENVEPKEETAKESKNTNQRTNYAAYSKKKN